jgi:hypothetical protein
MHDSGASQGARVELGYEHRDIQLKPLAFALFGLIGLIVVSILGILWFYDFTSPRYAQDKGKPRWETERKLPPHPQLQSFPKDEMSMYLKAEDAYAGSLAKAKASAAAKGISGVTDADVAPVAEKHSFPGSGDFGKAESEGSGHAQGAH